MTDTNHSFVNPADPASAEEFGGVHDPSFFHDGCGVACVARLDGHAIHETIDRALVALDRLEHRGAAGADESTGDGAGIMFGLPHEFFRSRTAEIDTKPTVLPGPGRLAVAMCFVRRDADEGSDAIQDRIGELVTEAGHTPIGWRQVPVDETSAGQQARDCAPQISQLFIEAGPDIADEASFDRSLYVVRRRAESEIGSDVFFPSMSCRTIVYKGMLTAPQLPQFYPDLRDRSLRSTFAIVHSRFSTNTAPSWELAQPLRMIAHNGEINTLRGNVNWMRAREAVLSSESFGEDLADCLPLIDQGVSDSAAFDRAFELMVLAGRSPQHAMMMMIPASWEDRDDVPAELEGFYRYHSRLLEPWDGPAGLSFCDGHTLGAMLDRNGLRPGRWMITRDGWVCIGSESGIFTTSPNKIARMGRLHPAQLFIVDLETGLVRTDGEPELAVAISAPYGEWYAEGRLGVRELPDPMATIQPIEPLLKRQLAFGYSQEDLRILLAPLLRDGREPTGSMGNDVALAVFSDHRPSLFSYFKQRFAQVTNPAIDSVREQCVMSLRTDIGPQGNLLSDQPQIVNHVDLNQPILTDFELERLRRNPHNALHSTTIDTTWSLDNGEDGLEAALERIREQAITAVRGDTTLLVLSDRATSAERVPVPALLACSTVHHALTLEGTRLRAALVVESGEPREVHHLAALIGYGATAINPYLMLETMTMLDEPTVGLNGPLADANEMAIAGISKGLLKVLSKIGIATIRSYRGAQIFEIIGISQEVVDEHFTGTPSTLGGIGLGEIAREALDRHARAYPEAHGLALAEHVEEAHLPAASEKLLPQGGVYRWRRDGEKHMWDPETISSLQRAARSPEGDGQESYLEFSRRVNEENASHALLRGLLEFNHPDGPIPLEEVEPAPEIVKRFSTGAMSLGALSPEAHETLAIAMNRLGGSSNSGEGGEDRRRNTPDPNGDQRRSRIRQVASGRFGVDVEYLSRADQIQIKIAQGAKPGEGGQLPGHKVDDYIGALRYALPGTELISPPPHHDIYSIEDLKQLIYDLRAANPGANVSVKLAAESGVGTVAVGCVKAGADHIVIAGHDGGTGASPLSSIQGAGVPWEIGIAETQQALLDSDLRTRVILQTDGQMRTGRDVVMGALLGADEIGLSTAPLIATGCIMMRVCHLNTCPVGVATQDPELRARFSGKPEHVVTYMIMVAEEARGIMASLGIRRFSDLVGRTELLRQNDAIEHWKASAIDMRPLLAVPAKAVNAPRGFVSGDAKEHPVGASFDERQLLGPARPAIERGESVSFSTTVTNIDLAVGGRVSNALVVARGADGLPDDTIEFTLAGSAGQTAGAWLAPGITIDIHGDVNDYAGKGMSGGILAVRPAEDAGFRAERNVIAGNVALYGATAGKAFFRGLAGERFAVRNSGALAVVEGIGEHGCEYMTGGCVVVLGPTGRNFGAGMSGGIACIWDPRGEFAANCNMGMVELEPVHPAGNFFLHDLVAEHARRTDSPVAADLLDRWEEATEEFVVVIPPGFRAALAHTAPPAKGRTVNLA
jgi:glutamate synthase domain-containing protein 2/glutamate synthase domain-containing protein 1/glutamate synthase domain-containing protein 3